jgi:hypothetical protein
VRPLPPPKTLGELIDRLLPDDEDYAMRFKIRDLLWLTIVIAVCSAWYGEYRVYDHNYRVIRINLAVWSRLVEEYLPYPESAELRQRVSEEMRPVQNETYGELLKRF